MADEELSGLAAVVSYIEASYDNIGTSWLWEWNLPSLFQSLINFYADSEDDPQGWFVREKAAAVAARAAMTALAPSPPENENTK